MPAEALLLCHEGGNNLTRHLIIATIILIGITASIGSAEAHDPTTTPDHPANITELLPFEPESYGNDVVDGMALRSHDSYLALFMAGVRDTRPVQITIEIDSVTYYFECGVYLYPMYENDYRLEVDGSAALIVLHEDSPFWSYLGSDIDDIYFTTADGRIEQVGDMFMYRPEYGPDAGSQYRYSADNGWKTWLEDLGNQLGYYRDSSDI